MKPDEIITAALQIIDLETPRSTYDESRVIIDALDAAQTQEADQPVRD